MASWGFRHPRGEDLDLLWDFGTAIPMSVRDSSLATGSPSKEPKDESCCRERVNENVCGPQMHFQIYPWPSCYCCLHYTIWNCGKAKQGQGPVLLFLWSSYNQIWKVQIDHCISHKWKCIAHFTVFENQAKMSNNIYLCHTALSTFGACPWQVYVFQSFLKQFHLIVGLGILYFELSILVFQFTKFIGNPILDARRFRFHCFCVSKT